MSAKAHTGSAGDTKDSFVTYRIPSSMAIDLELLLSRVQRMAELLIRLEDDELSSGDERIDIMSLIADTAESVERIVSVGRVAVKAGAR